MYIASPVRQYPLSGEEEVRTFTTDEVYSALSDFRAQIREEIKNSELSDSYLDCLNKMLELVDALGAKIQIDSHTEYYIFMSMTDLRARLDIKVSYFCNSLMCKGQIIRKIERVKLTLEGAAEIIETEAEDVYLNVLDVLDALAKPIEIYEELPALKSAYFINNECRIFECKDCHSVTYVEKGDDEWKRAHGLQPVQRCEQCIHKRKIRKLSVMDQSNSTSFFSRALLFIEQQKAAIWSGFSFNAYQNCFLLVKQ